MAEVDYEDLTTMRLDDAALHELLDAGGECVFNWTTRKGESIVHAPGDPGFDELKDWFYPQLSGADAAPDDTYRQAFAKFLDSEHRVIIETNARLVVAFDVAKFQSFTNEAIQAGMN